jgi:hypothetical protein
MRSAGSPTGRQGNCSSLKIRTGEFPLLVQLELRLENMASALDLEEGLDYLKKRFETMS